MRCPSCLEEGTLTCVTCKNVKYCSRVCQQADWQFHRHLCKTFQSFSDRLSPEMRRVVVFPPEAGEKPQFQWLAITNMPWGDMGQPLYQDIDIEKILGDASVRRIGINQNKITGAGLDVGIDMCFDDDFGRNYSSANATVRAATNRKAAYDWRGPLVAYCGEVNRVGDMMKIGDMNMSLYSDVVAQLIDYCNDTSLHKLRKGPKVEGVRAHCFGAQSVGPSAKVTVPRMHPIFDEGQVSAISKIVGMPLLLRKDFAKKAEGPIDPKHSNSALTAMMLACDVANPSTFGRVSPQWQVGQLTNTLVVCQDRSPLAPDLLEAFGDFCENVLQPRFERAAEDVVQGGKRGSSAEMVMSQVTLAKWVEYLSTWSTSKR